jgi:hypothetical protein
MDFNEAVRKSVKKFLSGKMDMTEVSTVSKSEIVYTLSFFDNLEEEMTDEVPKGKKKNKKEKVEDES